MPEGLAVVMPYRRAAGGKRRYTTWTFRQLDADSDRLAAGLLRRGVVPGTRLALLTPPSFEFVSLVFALFKAGAVQVLIDPGMGKRNVLRCLDEVQPQGFIAVPQVHVIRVLLGRRYAAAKFLVTVGQRRGWWGGVTLDELRGAEVVRFEPIPVGNDDPAAIIFTSGSTGPPKGVLYRHGHFAAQVEQLREMYGIRPGGVDLACFPLFALFNAALGLTTVIPDMDASRPARVDPANIVEAIRDWNVTQSFASPAVWNKVGRYCREQGVRLPTLRRVFSAGAPVPASVLADMKACIADGGEAHTPYGATEALPVATIEAAEVLGETAARTRAGGGVCVGRPFPGIRWKVIGIVDGPLASLADIRELPGGEIGELIVSGPVVTREYVARPQSNAWGKIADGAEVWHRMGDVGYLDQGGRFWFCGRLSQRVLPAAGPMYTIPCEAIFNCHPDVSRTALVGVGPPGKARPVMVVEPRAGKWPAARGARERFLSELRALGKSNPLTEPIEDFLLHRSFPVDVRHNAKIFREKLAVWAANRLQRS